MARVGVCVGELGAGQRLGQVLRGLPGVRDVLLVEHGEQLEAAWPSWRPDLTLIEATSHDLDGVGTAARLLARHPEAAVVVLVGRPTDPVETAAVVDAVQAGARGYLRLTASRTELAAGLALASTNYGPRSSHGEAGELTPREVQVLVAMSRGRSNAEIGRELYLAEDTVKTHARRVFRKLGAIDRAHAVALGFRAGLLH